MANERTTGYLLTFALMSLASANAVAGLHHTWTSMGVAFTLPGFCSAGKLLFILLDGFRWDYADQASVPLPALRQAMARGVRAEYLLSDFPSKSYVNLYTLMTGLHAETHGIVANRMREGSHSFYPSLNASQGEWDFWYGGGEPVWATAAKQGKASHLFHWPGCQAGGRGPGGVVCLPYVSNLTLGDLGQALDSAVRLFKQDEAQLVGIYFEGTDDIGHRHGPLSVEVNALLVQVDSQLARLTARLQQEELVDEVNVMVFSDHGMAELSQTRVINLTSYLPMDTISALENEYCPYVMIWPQNSSFDQQILDSLQSVSHVRAYRRDDTPAAWHYRHHPRMAPLLAVADVGWCLETPDTPLYVYTDTGLMRGAHGYDPRHPDMHAFFAAWGPNFKSGYVSKPFANVNLYEVMCRILGIQPSPNNGSWSEVKDMLTFEMSGSVPVENSMVTLVVAILLARAFSF